ncbi:hypothetical protein KGP93_27800 [Burkholderia multivorans]|nr:hypothetical protein [Burkholderia multivorans]
MQKLRAVASLPLDTAGSVMLRSTHNNVEKEDNPMNGLSKAALCAAPIPDAPGGCDEGDDGSQTGAMQSANVDFSF